MDNQHRFRIAVRGLIERDGCFLLLRRTKPARGEMGYWELPGGGLDFGESPEQALRREIDEETGLTVSIGEPLCVWHHLRDNAVQIIGMTLRCQLTGGSVKLSDEHDDYAWLTIEQIEQKKVFPELLSELQKIKLL